MAAGAHTCCSPSGLACPCAACSSKCSEPCDERSGLVPGLLWARAAWFAGVRASGHGGGIPSFPRGLLSRVGVTPGSRRAPGVRSLWSPCGVRCKHLWVS